MSMTIGDVTLTEEELQDGFSAEEIFSSGGARGEDGGGGGMGTRDLV